MIRIIYSEPVNYTHWIPSLNFIQNIIKINKHNTIRGDRSKREIKLLMNFVLCMHIGAPNDEFFLVCTEAEQKSIGFIDHAFGTFFLFGKFNWLSSGLNTAVDIDRN